MKTGVYKDQWGDIVRIIRIVNNLDEHNCLVEYEIIYAETSSLANKDKKGIDGILYLLSPNRKLLSGYGTPLWNAINK